MIQPFWAVVSKLKHRFTIHCKHLNSAVSKLRYNDKTSVTCNTNTYRRHKLSISTSLFAKAFHKVPCLYIQLLYSELITYGLLVTGTFKKQVPELNLWRWPYPYGENFFLTLGRRMMIFMQNQLNKTGLWSWSYFRVTDKILSANEVKEASGVVVVVVYFCIFLWSKPTPPP